MSIKICVLGDPSVGKTCLIRRYEDDHGVVPGVLHRPAPLALPTGDGLPGEAPFVLQRNPASASTTSIKSLCGEAVGAFIVSDLTRPDTLETARFYANLFRVAHPGSPLVFLANKVDAAVLTSFGTADVAALAASFDAPWFACSALTGSGIGEAFEAMEQLIATGSYVQPAAG